MHLHPTLTTLARTAVACCALAATLNAHATTYTENFDAPFPAWQSGWFGTMSNAQNYCATNYCWIGDTWAIGPTVSGQYGGIGSGGMWLGNTNNNPFTPVQVTFDATFGASLSSLSFDIDSYVDSSLLAFDSNGQQIFSQVLDVHDYHDVPPTTWQHFTITSTTGISSFEITGMTLGNVIIDNVVATTAPVPEPASAALLIGGLALVGGATLRHRRRG